MESELIKRYTYAVTQQLPEKQRADIEKELTGLIEDMLRDRVGDGPAGKHDIEAVLLELGSPADLADKYRGYQRYLIGPTVFPTYLSIIKIVLMAIGIAMVVVFAIQSILDPAQVLNHFVNGLNAFVMGCFQAFAWITVIFAVIERRGGGKEDKREETRKWHPSQLPPLPSDETRIKRSSPVAGIIFPVVFGVLLTFGLNLFGVWISQNGAPATVIPIFDAEVFRGYLPFIWIVLALTVLNETLKLITGKWTVPLVAFGVGVNIVGFALALAMLTNSGLWNPDFMAQMVQAGLTPATTEAYQTVNTIWEQAHLLLPYAAVVIFAIQIIATVVKVLRMKSAAFNNLVNIASID